jgi:hypothetical protein
MISLLSCHAPNGKAEPQRRGGAEPSLRTSLPTKSKGRDTMSAEGAVGSSECWAATFATFMDKGQRMLNHT